MQNSIYSFVCLAALTVGISVYADDMSSQSAPAPSQHQMMKECMAKQKASDGGMPKEDMKKSCKDITKTESDNAKVDKASTPPAKASAPN